MYTPKLYPSLIHDDDKFPIDSKGFSLKAMEFLVCQYSDFTVSTVALTMLDWASGFDSSRVKLGCVYSRIDCASYFFQTHFLKWHQQVFIFKGDAESARESDLPLKERSWIMLEQKITLELLLIALDAECD